ncbi:MAG: triose-phosphate isomerase [Nanoarchaeota archaeon]|nr:triose-phosphate isomerase [Nanoarchaeota archaeon]MBU1622892.1 triose-phosphate isomerase [Nanoarchaeota archaeon]
MKTLVLINFKTYKEVSGENALAIAKKIALVKRNKYQIVIAPPTLSLKEVCQKSKARCFAQHVDYKDYGSNTGRVLPVELKKIGCQGAIINHSEHRLPLEIIKKTIMECKKRKLITVVCATTLAKIKKIAQFKPDYIAYEPAGLIGGDISVTKSKPEIIVKAVETVKKISPRTKVLAGAGVHSQEDLGQALLLGCQGVLIAHAVVKAKDPKKFLERMLI